MGGNFGLPAGKWFVVMRLRGTVANPACDSYANNPDRNPPLAFGGAVGVMAPPPGETDWGG